MSRARTGRELVLEWLNREIRAAKTADLQRAAAFLQWARDVRKGCAKQRGGRGWRRPMHGGNGWMRMSGGETTVTHYAIV